MTHFEPGPRPGLPRHLVGAGIDRLANAIGPLIRLFGWPNEHERATGRITVSSPDGTLFVNFNSRHTSEQWWQVAHHEPFWEAQFTRQTAFEAIAAVTPALPQLIGDQGRAAVQTPNAKPAPRCAPTPLHTLRSQLVRPR